MFTMHVVVMVCHYRHAENAQSITDWWLTVAWSNVGWLSVTKWS